MFNPASLWNKLVRKNTSKIVKMNENKNNSKSDSSRSDRDSANGVKIKITDLIGDETRPNTAKSDKSPSPAVVPNDDIDEFIADESNEFDETQLRLKGVTEEKIMRMKRDRRRKACLIYPDNPRKAQWDLWITLVLLITCILTPLTIAFTKESEDDSNFSFSPSQFVEMFFDFNFLIDIVINFTSCYYQNEVDLIDDPKVIACTYLKGWFFVDFISIIPIDIIFNVGGFTQLLRVAKIGKLGKLVKLTRLLRVLKIMKDQSRILSYLNDFLKIGLGFERLFFFGLIFFIVCHILTCLWIIVASLQDDEFLGTWIAANEFQKEPDEVLYAVSFYWCISTITTVGYGDISGTTTMERIFCAIIMLVGVISFSFANGALASIISNSDQANAKYQEKEITLNKIR